MKATHKDFNGLSGLRFMTTGEVLDYLRVNSQTIYRLIRRGDLPAVRVGRQWRFRQTDLDAWLDHQRLCRTDVVAETRRVARPATER